MIAAGLTPKAEMVHWWFATGFLMLGTGEGSALLIRRMNMFPQYGYHVVGVASDEVVADGAFVGVPVVGIPGQPPTPGPVPAPPSGGNPTRGCTTP